MKTCTQAPKYGWIPGKQYSPETIKRARQIHAFLVAFFDGDKVYKLVNTNVTRLDDRFHFMLEIVGPEVCPRQKIETLQAQLAKEFSEPLNLDALSRAEIVYGPEGLLSLKELNQYFSERQKENLPDDIPLILEASRH